MNVGTVCALLAIVAVSGIAVGIVILSRPDATDGLPAVQEGLAAVAIVLLAYALLFVELPSLAGAVLLFLVIGTVSDFVTRLAYRREVRPGPNGLALGSTAMSIVKFLLLLISVSSPA